MHGRWFLGISILSATALVATVVGLSGSDPLERAGWPERHAQPVEAAERPAEAVEAVSFSRDIRPILANNCLTCHGPDDDAREADLRLDTFEDATRLIDGRQAIVPGDPEASEMVKRIAADDPDVRMPPASIMVEDPMGHPVSVSYDPLGPEQVELVRRWIEQGAEYEPHWAFTKPEKPALPSVENEAWVRNGIDRFVLARMEAEGLEPSAEADRRTLIRRVTLDLTGLPPTPERVEAFVNDDSPTAYKELVDELLDSPRYGERWARPWLDLARYADTQGYEKDNPREIWRYRDWVIQAFNEDMPFDQFTIEQLAGDLLPEPEADHLLATAFHRNTMTNTEGGTDEEEFRVAAVVDRVNTTGTVWMGLTMSCAQCHTHKYDPITHEDYYSFFDFFNQTADEDRPDEHPTLLTPTEQQQAELEALRAEFERIQAEAEPEPDEAEPTDEPEPSESAEAEAEVETESEVDEAVQTARERLESFEESLPHTPIMQELPEQEQRETHILLRGDFLNPGERVTASVPEVFGVMPEEYPRNRLGLARWLVHPDHPLTARVQVNRYWYLFFGEGIVKSLDDFGLQSDLPTHPELLDWLAIRFMEDRWSMKELCRLIVTSATYRQSSSVTPERLERDPNNELLTRGPRFRMEAEMLRDQAMAVAGLLNEEIGGPSVLPAQPASTLTPQAFSDYVPEVSEGEDRFRRGIYTFWRRTGHYPSFATFDAPSREVCNIQRSRTNTPLQAMVMLNDPVYVEAAQALARRLIREGEGTPTQRIDQAYRLCLARPPSEAEAQTLLELYRDVRRHYGEDAEAAGMMASAPLGPLPEGMEAEEAAAWTVVANVLMNLDEFLTRG